MSESEMIEKLLSVGLTTALLRKILRISEKVLYCRLKDGKWYLHADRICELYEAYEKEGVRAWACIMNNGVNCTDLHEKCDTCGWNPKVAEQREKEFKYLWIRGINMYEN